MFSLSSFPLFFCLSLSLSLPFSLLFLSHQRPGLAKSRTVFHSLNPIYNEMFLFKVARHELDRLCLRMRVWDYDSFSADDFMGETIIELNDENLLLNSAQPPTIWHELKTEVRIGLVEAVPPPPPPFQSEAIFGQASRYRFRSELP